MTKLVLTKNIAQDIAEAVELFLVRDPRRIKELMLEHMGQDYDIRLIRETMDRMASLQILQKPKFPKANHVSEKPHHKWYFDLIDLKGGSFASGWLLTIIDHYTRYAWVVYMQNKKKSTTLKAFKPIYKKYSPDELIADQGPEFIDINKMHAIKYGDPGNHYNNAPIERFNRTIIEKINQEFTIGKLNKANWKKRLSSIVSVYNHTIHSATKQRPIDILEGYPDVKSSFRGKVGRFKLRKGDPVRLVMETNQFTKKSRTHTLSKKVYRFVAMQDGLYLLNDGKVYRQRYIQPVKEPFTVIGALPRPKQKAKKKRTIEAEIPVAQPIRRSTRNRVLPKRYRD